MTRVAALYDIHGNVPALRAVLDEIDSLSVEVIVIGGDIAWGPFPKETLTMLRALGERVVWLRGNADREVADANSDNSAVTRWCAEQLSNDERRFLGELPLSVVLEIYGLGATLFCHASPRSDEESITEATAEDVVAPMLAGIEQSVVVCGHTHMQFDRSIGDARVVNAGSVGMPYEDVPGAYWTLLGPDIERRRSTFDFSAAAVEVRGSGCPDADEMAAEITSPTGREAATLHFERSAGRD